MSAEIVNLRLARKAKTRAAHAADGAANRAKHGRTGAEREVTLRESEIASRRHDGHLLDRPLDGPLGPGDGDAA